MSLGLKKWVTTLFNKGDHIGSPVPYVNFCSIVGINRFRSIGQNNETTNFVLSLETRE